MKQVDQCPRGGPLSPVSSNMYMCKRGNVRGPTKPIFCWCYCNDTYVRSKKNINDELFIIHSDMHCYIKNIKSTLEVNPKKYLDVEIIRINITILF